MIAQHDRLLNIHKHLSFLSLSSVNFAYPAHITPGTFKTSCIWPLYLLLRCFLIRSIGNSANAVSDSNGRQWKLFSNCMSSVFLKPILHEKAFGQSICTEHLKTANVGVVNLGNKWGGGGEPKQFRVTAGTGIAVESRESHLEPVLDVVWKLPGGEWLTPLDQSLPRWLQAEDLTAG